MPVSAELRAEIKVAFVQTGMKYVSSFRKQIELREFQEELTSHRWGLTVVLHAVK